MRLHELQIPDDRFDAGQILQHAGYKKLGFGGYAQVWGREDKPYVVKIFDSEDLAYPKFVALARQHQDNPHFPKFFGKMVQLTPKYYAIRMEKLSLLSDDSKVGDYLYHYVAACKSARAYHPENFEEIRQWIDDQPKLKEACWLVAKMPFPLDINGHNIMARGDTVVFTDPIYADSRPT